MYEKMFAKRMDHISCDFINSRNERERKMKIKKTLYDEMKPCEGKIYVSSLSKYPEQRNLYVIRVLSVKLYQREHYHPMVNIKHHTINIAWTLNPRYRNYSAICTFTGNECWVLGMYQSVPTSIKNHSQMINESQWESLMANCISSTKRGFEILGVLDYTLEKK